jgi:microcompartment protein CcmL/EutN
MPPPEGTALGLVETKGLIAGIEACDAMLKAADVRLVGMEQTVPALITVKVVGETAAVRSAVDAGAAAAERVGAVVSRHVIPRPAADVVAAFVERATPRPSAPPIPGGTLGGEASRTAEDLDERTVKELREMAREIEDFPLRGREISRATKDELVALLRTS